MKSETNMKIARKWEGVPGVVYPEKKDGTPRPNDGGALLREAPKGFIPTAEAAELLGVMSLGAARCLLARRGVKRVFVAGPGLGRAFYSREAVRRVARRLPKLGEVPPGLVSASEAVAVYGLSRASLDRSEKCGLLHVVRLRVRGRAGARERVFYAREELLCVRRIRERRLREQLESVEGRSA